MKNRYRQNLYGFMLMFFVLIGILCFTARIVYAHSSFYPHHVQDFGAIKDSIKEMRGKVIITTIVFVAVLTGVIILALRKGNVDRPAHETDQARLEQAIFNAAQAAAQTGFDKDGSRALRAAIVAYAQSVGVSLSSNALEKHTSPIRCKIRNDRILAQIVYQNGDIGLEIRATCDTASMNAFVDKTGRITEISHAEK
ncbi:TPA: hypothetical protein EYP66_13435 [Candidatus Poribacteria bacterium]|nr:hypothetical protein [Candidatus Poribacteria bacterium]